MTTKYRKRRKPHHLTITNQIDVNYRDYALYVLEQRGIPSYYDGLTNVQRLVLQNAPPTFNKTMSLVGKCFSAGYHHGDASLIGAINKITRSFNCAAELLEGDGFFGTPLNPKPAAARYTSVKIEPSVNKIIKENNFLNNKNDEGTWNPLWLDQPLGLDTMIVGIAVGYKTTILPRHRVHVKQFLEGKRKGLKPYFKGFTGKISKFKNLDKSWLFEGVVVENDKLQTLHIKDLPPLMKYKSFVKKLDKIIDHFDARVDIKNDSSTNVDLLIKFKGVKNEWSPFKAAVIKASKMLVTETPIFIKDGLVLEYEKIEDYLTDYKYRIAELNLEKEKYFFEEATKKISFNEAKKLYLEFMLKGKRTLQEIEKFLNRFPKEISSKLDGVLLKHLNTDELKKTINLIAETKKLQTQIKNEIKKLQTIFDKMEDTADSRGTSGKASSIDLFSDEMMDYDGVEIYSGIDEEENDEEENEK